MNQETGKEYTKVLKTATLAATPGDPRLHRYAETILEFAGEPDAPYWDETIAQLARQCVERHSPASRSEAADGGKGEI